MKYDFNKKNAFSLPELLIFLAIVGVISVMMMTVIKPGEKALKYQYYNAYNTLSVAAYNIVQDIIEINNYIEQNPGSSGSFAADDKKFPDNTIKFCARFAVNPTNPNFKYGYINTTDFNCAGLQPIDNSPTKNSFTDSKMAFRASNSMKYYISSKKTSTIRCDLDNVNVSISYFIVWVDINGDRGPNTPVWSENKPADIVPFIVTTTGKVIPIGQPTVDRRYMQAYVDIEDTESSEYTPSTTFYQAQVEAFGEQEYPSVDLTSILWDSRLTGYAKKQDTSIVTKPEQRNICKATQQEIASGDYVPPCTVIVEEPKRRL